ncbi:MAG: hypothetical protein ABI333_11970 [bacterium]
MVDQALTLGIDEAGRGAVLGPLVIAGCALTSRAADRLARAGVDDSKGFGPPERAQAIRAELAALIEIEAAWTRIVIVDPERVDASVRRKRLNVLEREVAEEIIRGAPSPVRIVLDGARLFGPLCLRIPNAVALDRADQQEICVAAASILAKTRRDRCYDEIRARYEPLLGPIRGQGYPNRATERFLRTYTERHGCLPPEIRRSWSWEPLKAFTTADERGEAPTLDFDSY